MNRDKSKTKADKAKAETYEMWKERKLIEELKHRQQATETEKLKTTLNERLSEGRRVLNELAINNWLKKKQEGLTEKNRKVFDSVKSEKQPSINYVRRKTVKAKVDTKMYRRKETLMPQKETEKPVVDTKVEEVSERHKSKDDTLREDLAVIAATEDEQSLSNITNKSRRSVASKSVTASNDKKQIKNQGELSLNQQICKELQHYLRNPNAYEMSERQTKSKISFEQWLKKKNAQIREKKEKEKLLQELQEKERIEREKISERAINEWYLKNAFRMVTRDKFLKNRKAKNRWRQFTEMLNRQTESESLSESLEDFLK